ncbi:Beta-site APP-cleaving enzyme [Linnemannia zychae]|nr:Beta-site APP-cleaving enzyme [Linnemannia zychae]
MTCMLNESSFNTERELAFWTPITDALSSAGDAIASIFHKDTSSSTVPAIGTTTTVTVTDTDQEVNDDGGVGKAGYGERHVVASADDYGVAHLDLEGDPNCDYTTKVMIAGSEYNVIIDTGSAHFAVASNACKDCIIPRKDRFRPDEEEEIPIDLDVDTTDTIQEDIPTYKNGAFTSDQTPWDLFKELSKKIKSISAASTDPSPTSTFKTPPIAIKTATFSSSSITTITTSASIAYTTSFSPSSSLGIKSSRSVDSLSATALLNNNVGFSSPTSTLSISLSSTTTIPSGKRETNIPTLSSISVTQGNKNSLAILPSIVVIPDRFHIDANARFSDNRDRLKKLKAEVAAVTDIIVQPIVPIDIKSSSEDNININQRHHQQHNQNSLLSRYPESLNNSHREYERTFVAAPAENLYPLSNNARDRGESIRVSYGIKSHAVGWSGVLTSDLLTLEMAKVKPGNNSVVSNLTTDAPGTQHLENGGLMEKETNVGFAAIMENTGFFSQECGAQHGIWGLGYSSLSVDRKPTLFDTISASMKVPNGFALQLCGRISNTTKSGNMFLGGYSSSHLAEPMQFVPLVKRDWYQVQLDGFRVMGAPVLGMQNLNVPKTIVDSGTTNILMSHYNLQFLIDALAQSDVIQWSSLIPEQDINNFWFRNAVLRLPRSSFRVATKARALEMIISGVAIPIYTASFLRIKSVPAGQAPNGYVDFWWHGFASSTAPDAIDAERASGGVVTPGAVGTILGETLFAGKVVYFERGNEHAQSGDADFGRIGFARGKNCFAPADHRNVDVLASQGQVTTMDLERIGPVRVAATSDASGIRLVGSISNGQGGDIQTAGINPATSGQGHREAQPPLKGGQIPIHGLDKPIRIMGGSAAGISRPWTSGNFSGFLRGVGAGLFVAYLACLL